MDNFRVLFEVTVGVYEDSVSVREVTIWTKGRSAGTLASLLSREQNTITRKKVYMKMMLVRSPHTSRENRTSYPEKGVHLGIFLSPEQNAVFRINWRHFPYPSREKRTMIKEWHTLGIRALTTERTVVPYNPTTMQSRLVRARHAYGNVDGALVCDHLTMIGKTRNDTDRFLSFVCDVRC